MASTNLQVQTLRETLELAIRTLGENKKAFEELKDDKRINCWGVLEKNIQVQIDKIVEADKVFSQVCNSDLFKEKKPNVK